MTTNQIIPFHAGFAQHTNIEDASPDIYYLDSSGRANIPSDNFRISRDKEGNVLSCYGDDIWDFGPYIYTGNTAGFRIHFEKLPLSTIRDTKWLVFIMLYLIDTGRATGLTASTILDSMKPIRSLAKYSDEQNIKIYEVLRDEKHLTKFVLTLKTKGKLIQFAGLLSHLNKIGSSQTGIEVLRGLNIDEIRQRAYKLEPDNQHPVIPPRILSEIVKLLHQYIALIVSHLPRIEDFLIRITTDEKYARCRTKQIMLGFKGDELGPFFIGSAKQYKLDKLFNNLGVKNTKNLSTFITRTQHACKLVIHIYSGMRNSEVFSLKNDCLKKESINNKTSYRIHGETSKLVGQNVAASWVTSDSVVDSIKVLEGFSAIIGKQISLDEKDIPLFIAPSYLGFMGERKYNHKYISLSNTSLKSQEIYNYLELKKLQIQEVDLNYLNKIDPFRAWDAEETFKVGSVWRFTTHQFRRSLAFYVLQSGLVSLPTLKRQLKHISREMTTYYSQTHDLEEAFDKKDHISHMVRKVKPEVDALAYLSEVLLADEPLYGAGGKFIEKNNKLENNTILLKEDRKKLATRFKKGELAYKTTPLGACTSLKPCNEKATRSVTACISCDRSVIKLSKLDRVIELQNAFVEELEALDEKSIEYRTEEYELSILKSFKNKVINKGL